MITRWWQVMCGMLLCSILNLPAQEPEIRVGGNDNTEIVDGDNTPDQGDGTYMTEWFPGTVFVIENNGELDLELTGSPVIKITGVDSNRFNVVAPLPDLTIAPGDYTTFGVEFLHSGTSGTFNAQIVIANSDADEDPYNFAIQGYRSPPDTTPPNPNPMTWSTPPYAIGASGVTMVATLATDSATPVEYYFDEMSGHAGGTDSGWQTNRTYTDTGLSQHTLYQYRVSARDYLGNTTVASSIAEATTTSPDSDGDGLTDWDEVNLYGTNPSLRDSDSDGLGDGDEVEAGTAPTNRNDVFKVESCSGARGSDNLVLGWTALTGRIYRVFENTDLYLVWSTTSVHTVTGLGARTEYTNDNQMIPQGFYRISVRKE